MWGGEAFTYEDREGGSHTEVEWAQERAVVLAHPTPPKQEKVPTCSQAPSWPHHDNQAARSWACAGLV